MAYDPEAPYEYILAAYANILNVGITLVQEVGHIIPIPQFDSEILEDLCKAALNLFVNTPTVLEIDGPIIVVGDLHGNIFDLFRLIAVNQPPPFCKYLFLGDYIDRGQFSVEVITIIIALALKYPKHIFLLRGNHEVSLMNSLYGFKRELQKNNYSLELWEIFNSVFDILPFAAIISKRIFCVHGGLSPELTSIDILKKIRRPISPQASSLLLDLVWSDPISNTTDFQPSLRGSGKSFGRLQIEQFLKDFRFNAIFRGHQCVNGGVERFGDTQLYTIFSCSNYCASYANRSGFMSVYENGKFNAYSLPPIVQIDRQSTSLIKVPTAFIPTLLLQKIDKNRSEGLEGRPILPILISIGCEEEEETLGIKCEPVIVTPIVRPTSTKIRSFSNPFSTSSSAAKLAPKEKTCGIRKKHMSNGVMPFILPSILSEAM